MAKQQLAHTMRIPLKKGMTVYEMNAATGKIFAANYSVHPKSNIAEVKTRAGHIYVPALNVKNAERKFTNNVNQLLNQLNDESKD